MAMVYRPGHPKANKNGLVDKRIAYEHFERGEAAYVISDEMPSTRHMCDGKHYTSKAKFRSVTKAFGCVEVGNESATLLKPRKPVELDRGQRRNDIRRALWQLRNGGG